MPNNISAVSYGQNLQPEALAQTELTLRSLGNQLIAGTANTSEKYPSTQIAGYESVSWQITAIVDTDNPSAAQIAGTELISSLRMLISGAPQDGIDTAIVPSSLRTAQRKFIIMDVDSTLIQQEVIEMLAAHVGKEAEVKAVTDAAMRGELDFAQSLHHRVATLADLPESVLENVSQAINLSQGAERLIDTAKAAGHVVAAVSGGFSQILEPLAKRLGLDFALANELEIVDGVLTGRVLGDVVDRATKATKLREWSAISGIDLSATMAIGDGANDLDMLEAAALGVAFNAKPAVRALADAQINIPRLDVALDLAGIY